MLNRGDKDPQRHRRDDRGVGNDNQIQCGKSGLQGIRKPHPHPSYGHGGTRELEWIRKPCHLNVVISLLTNWQEGADSTEIDAARQVLLDDMKIVEGIAPESGASLLEGSRNEFDWKKSFFGAHYEKLLVIKKKYDPQSLFLVYEGVASDEWDADLICRV